MRLLEPDQTVTYQMRGATALAPDSYYPSVVKGDILPYRTGVKGFSEGALLLADGREIPCDLVVLATGHSTPQFPFLPSPYREWVESEKDGAQLYRHLLHPRIPRLSFSGFNHGFLHIPAVEIATLWLAAHLRGDLTLPPPEEMERSIEKIRAWKREHTLFEPARSCGTNTRFHQYLDTLLSDLGVTPYRKRSRLAEAVVAYGAADYAGVFDDYERARAARPLPVAPLPLDT
ncbi:MAG: hypothetical protein R3B70_35100 [Polyangiaceae bacterium]